MIQWIQSRTLSWKIREAFAMVLLNSVLDYGLREEQNSTGKPMAAAVPS